jgi:putative nucleotidyltransferase with HDIG domain
MAAFFKKSPKRLDPSPQRRQRKSRSSEDVGATHFFETSQLVEGGLFFIFAALVIIISFFGQQPKGPQLIVNQPAPARIVAEFDFEYTSELLREEQVRAVRAQVPPVFERSYEPYSRFRKLISEIQDRLAQTQINFEDQGEEVLAVERENAIRSTLEKFNVTLETAVILELTKKTTPKERASLFKEGLERLRNLYDDGVYATQRSAEAAPQVTVIQLLDEEGRSQLPEARSLEKATVSLRREIDSLSRNQSTARALFEIFRVGLEANLIYSESSTNRAIERATATITPPVQAYAKGDTLIEPGALIRAIDLERMKAYNARELAIGSDSIWVNTLFLKRTILAMALFIAVLIYIKQGLREVYKRNRAIAITAVSILLNLLIIRLVMEIGEIAAETNRPLLSMLPFIAPYALAPIVVAVLVGTSPAILSALIIAVLFGIIQDNSIEFMLIAFLSGAVGSTFAANIRKRSKLVRAGLYAGLAAATSGILLGVLNDYSAGLIGQQILIALIVGLLTGILAAGLLPVLEHLFKVTTEITLLELTDFNHPLLRRMQMEAPGTYHHSLMVANLSENAAAAIGASPLLCRVCCFFHDIGKLVKPEYFTENQRGGVNPHDVQNPSMSALVIKAHVKEGVELARHHKLPRVIIDVIRQHHGTSLIQYFYHQAQQKRQDRSQERTEVAASRSQDLSAVDESTYRYDGPRPAFKESAIIFFADGVEAASRSLKKVTQPAVEELIDTIFKDRIEDGQLDDCPLTFQELHQIRGSFVYTLLNMLHSRVEYPKETSAPSSAPAQPIPSDEPNSTGDQQPV